jgi:hypothetical protein
VAAIGRLFVEIGAKTTLTEDLARAQESLKGFGVKATKSGLSYLAAFEASLNPTKKLAEELTLLEKAGKSSGDIVAVLGDRIRTLVTGAQSAGRPVDDIVKKYADMSKEGGNAGNIFARFGETLTQFVTYRKNKLQMFMIGLWHLGVDQLLILGVMSPSPVFRDCSSARSRLKAKVYAETILQDMEFSHTSTSTAD